MDYTVPTTSGSSVLLLLKMTLQRNLIQMTQRGQAIAPMALRSLNTLSVVSHQTMAHRSCTKDETSATFNSRVTASPVCLFAITDACVTLASICL